MSFYTHSIFEGEDAFLAGNGGALVTAPIAGVLVFAPARGVPRPAAPLLCLLGAHVATSARVLKCGSFSRIWSWS